MDKIFDDQLEGKALEAYLDNPTKCPFCMMGDMEELDDPCFDYSYIWRTYGCDKCGEKWQEQYKLEKVFLEKVFLENK